VGNRRLCNFQKGFKPVMNDTLSSTLERNLGEDGGKKDKEGRLVSGRIKNLILLKNERD